MDFSIDNLTGKQHKNKELVANCDRLAILIEKFIHMKRGQQVMVDSDLARLYGVGTKELNQT